ncbi:MAG: alpha/beta fold hydrolase [Salinibacterium sp.]|nr:MAG: alpha/beta fold hydrolase [Salinibacterium sp.]
MAARSVRFQTPAPCSSDTGTGPLVVLLHGIASSWVTFENVIPLIKPNHRVIALDLLGFGASPAPDDADYTVAEHAAAIARTIRALRIRGRFVLVGHSMGAIIASRYAATHRSQVERLVLISPPIYLTPTEIGREPDRTAMGLYFVIYEFLRQNKEFTIRAATQLAQISPIKNLLEVSERNWRAFALSLQRSIESQTTLSDLASVRVPVELIYGTLDPFLALAGIQIVEQFRQVTAHRVSGGDHVIRPRMARVVATAIG